MAVNDVSAPANANPVPALPADSYSVENMGIVAELRLISMLLNEGFGLSWNLEDLRQQTIPFKK